MPESLEVEATLNKPNKLYKNANEGSSSSTSCDSYLFSDLPKEHKRKNMNYKRKRED